MRALFRPKHFIRRLQKEKPPRSVAGEARSLVREAARKLAEDVKQLPSHTDGGNAELRLALSRDVHENVQSVLRLINALTADDIPSLNEQRDTLLEVAFSVVSELVTADLPMTLLQSLPDFEFETRNGIMNMLCALMRADLPTAIDRIISKYLRGHPQVFDLVVRSYADEETALHYGVILRSFARHRDIVAALFDSGLFMEVLKHTRHHSIEVSSDAFCSVSRMIVQHHDISSAWLGRHAQEFFIIFSELLESPDYWTQRHALKLLVEMLRDSHFRGVMLAYVDDARNLKIMMNLLLDSSAAIHSDAFKIFALFVVNPSKSNNVHQILHKNRDKLARLIHKLSPDKPDLVFSKEQRLVVDKLHQLEAPVAAPARCRTVAAASPAAPAGLSL